MNPFIRKKYIFWLQRNLHDLLIRFCTPKHPKLPWFHSIVPVYKYMGFHLKWDKFMIWIFHLALIYIARSLTLSKRINMLFYISFSKKDILIYYKLGLSWAKLSCKLGFGCTVINICCLIWINMKWLDTYSYCTCWVDQLSNLLRFNPTWKPHT